VATELDSAPQHGRETIYTANAAAALEARLGMPYLQACQQAYIPTLCHLAFGVLGPLNGSWSTSTMVRPARGTISCGVCPIPKTPPVLAITCTAMGNHQHLSSVTRPKGPVAQGRPLDWPACSADKASCARQGDF